MPGLAGGPRLPRFYPNYSFIPVAAKPVESSWHGGKAESRNFRQRRSSLQSHLLENGGFSSTVLHTQSVHILQYTFMLPLKVVGPGGGLSALLKPFFLRDAVVECSGRRQRQWQHTFTTKLSSAGGWLAALTVEQFRFLMSAMDSKLCDFVFIFITLLSY
jgi:hypothetical protein